MGIDYNGKWSPENRNRLQQTSWDGDFKRMAIDRSKYLGTMVSIYSVVKLLENIFLHIEQQFLFFVVRNNDPYLATAFVHSLCSH